MQAKKRLSIPENNPMFGKIGGMKGKNHTIEARHKISEGRKMYWKLRKEQACVS